LLKPTKINLKGEAEAAALRERKVITPKLEENWGRLKKKNRNQQLGKKMGAGKANKLRPQRPVKTGDTENKRLGSFRQGQTDGRKTGKEKNLSKKRTWPIPERVRKGEKSVSTGSKNAKKKKTRSDTKKEDSPFPETSKLGGKGCHFQKGKTHW